MAQIIELCLSATDGVARALRNPKRFILLPLVCWFCRRVLRMKPMSISMRRSPERVDTYCGFFVMWETQMVTLEITLEPDPEPLLKVSPDGHGVELI